MDNKTQTMKHNFVHSKCYGGKESRVRYQKEANVEWTFMLNIGVWKGLWGEDGPEVLQVGSLLSRVLEQVSG